MAIDDLFKLISHFFLMPLRQKRGVLYLILAIVFVSIFVVLFLTFNQFGFQDDAEIIEFRVSSMNDFVINLHSDIDRASYITGFRTLLGLEEYLSHTGDFFADKSSLENSFAEAFLFGSINGTNLSILENSSFNEYLSRVSSQADILDIGVNVSISNVSINHFDAWNLKIIFSGVFNISDKRGSAWWSYDKDFVTILPIYNLKDPLYTVNTLGRVPNTVRNYSLPSVGFVDDFDNSTHNLQFFVNGSYYFNTTSAPSFLQRFYNDLSPDVFGIESVVYLPLLSDQSIITFDNRSVVDYLYFSGVDNSADRCSISGMIYSPDWFKLDNSHANDYEVGSFAYSSC